MVINIIGAGLAGSEAAYQLIKRGYAVRLFEMRPKKTTPAHTGENFAELVCSNSLRALSLNNAVGLLKEEMTRMDSLIMKAAKKSQIPAGGALAVDRNEFSSFITTELLNSPLVEFINDEVGEIPQGPTIIATGPLTSEGLTTAIGKFCAEDHLYFYDTVAPIIMADSINYDIVYAKSRYDKGEADYLNCPLTEAEFDHFYNALIEGEKVTPKDFEMIVFEACMPIEEMARRGRKTLLFGPMKPVGLENPKTGLRPFAVVQLRAENINKTLYNLVGFQTQLKFPEQKRVLRLIPGLEKCVIARYGVMHRNTYIFAPKVLNEYFQSNKRSDLFFAGQITGVEGYVESAASGMIAAFNMIKFLENKELINFTQDTALGALQYHISNKYYQTKESYVPMNVNFGLFNPIVKKMTKSERLLEYSKRSLAVIDKIKERI